MQSNKNITLVNFYINNLSFIFYTFVIFKIIKKTCKKIKY